MDGYDPVTKKSKPGFYNDWLVFSGIGGGYTRVTENGQEWPIHSHNKVDLDINNR